MFHFSDHTFDPDTGELDGPSESLRLQPKPARLLAMLLEAGGELVEREQIRAALWPDTNVDFDAGLNTCVRQIRNALRESCDDAVSIETLPKRGYRIVGVVEREDPLGATDPASSAIGRRPGAPATAPVDVVAAMTAAIVGAGRR